MKITLKEIANIAGVSTSTVSRVINNSKPRNLIKLCKGEREHILHHINVMHHLVPRERTKTINF